MKSLSLVVVVLLVPVGLVRGDIGPGPRDEKFPAMRFENLADYPDFDFYLTYAHGPGNPYGSPHLSRIRSGETFRQFEGSGRNGGAMLLAVPKGKPPPSVARDRDWFEKVPPGYLRSTLLEGTHLGEGYLVPYRVRIDKDKLEVTMQTPEIQPGEMTVSWLKRLPWIAVPVVLCVALAWLGVRMARRLFPPKGDASPSQASNTR